MMKRRQVLDLVGTAAAASLAGCSSLLEDASSSYENGVQIGCSGDAYPNRIDFDCERFDGEIGRIFPVDADASIDISCRAELGRGSVRFLAKSPDDEVLWEHSYGDTGSHETSATVEADADGRYHMRVEGEDVEGAFELRWELRE